MIVKRDYKERDREERKKIKTSFLAGHRSAQEREVEISNMVAQVHFSSPLLSAPGLAVFRGEGGACVPTFFTWRCQSPRVRRFRSLFDQPLFFCVR